MILQEPWKEAVNQTGKNMGWKMVLLSIQVLEERAQTGEEF